MLIEQADPNFVPIGFLLLSERIVVFTTKQKGQALCRSNKQIQILCPLGSRRIEGDADIKFKHCAYQTSRFGFRAHWLLAASKELAMLHAVLHE